MIKNDKVSIIIPVYNSEKYLYETIMSALSQSWENIEVILVDDGSTDNSLKIATSITSEKLIVLSQENLGATAARNFGLKHATGNYIQYLDADDLLSKDKIKNQLLLLQNKAEGFISSCYWGKFKNKIEKTVFEKSALNTDFKPVAWLINSWQGAGMMQTACWLIPKDIAEKAGYWNENLIDNPADDGEYFCRVLLKSNNIIFCEDSFVYYRDATTENRLSKSLSKNAVHSLFMNACLYEKYILEVEDSFRVRYALIFNYLNFIYRFHPQYKDLIESCFRNIENLGIEKMPLVGGKNFKLLTRYLGFKNSLFLRSLIKKSVG